MSQYTQDINDVSRLIAASGQNWDVDPENVAPYASPEPV